MKFELSLSQSVTANPKTVAQFKGSEFPYAKWNYKTFKNVRRLKHLAKKFNECMMKQMEAGIIREYEPCYEFELFATCESVLGMRPQGLRYQPYWIPVKAKYA